MHERLCVCLRGNLGFPKLGFANYLDKNVDKGTASIYSEIGIRINGEDVYRVFILSQTHAGILLLI